MPFMPHISCLLSRLSSPLALRRASPRASLFGGLCRLSSRPREYKEIPRRVGNGGRAVEVEEACVATPCRPGGAKFSSTAGLARPFRLGHATALEVKRFFHRPIAFPCVASITYEFV